MLPRAIDTVLDELEHWHSSMSGTNPLRAALERALQLEEQSFAARAAALVETRRVLALEQSELHAERARLEAGAALESALESSGLLDAWVLPEGTVIDSRTHDVILSVRPSCAHSLADWLTPTIPAAGGGAAIGVHTLSDDEARASCMGLIREFDLDFVMTSEREWGCYAELPGLSICQIVRREGMDAIFVSRWSWNGRQYRAEADPVRRFPEAAVTGE